MVTARIKRNSTFEIELMKARQILRQSPTVTNSSLRLYNTS